MARRAGQLVAAAAAVLLLLGLGRTTAPAATSGALTATSVGHNYVVVALVASGRVAAADPGARSPALAAAATSRSAPTPAGARDSTDGASRTPAPHLIASTGDRAPPALP